MKAKKMQRGGLVAGGGPGYGREMPVPRGVPEVAARPYGAPTGRPAQGAGMAGANGRGIWADTGVWRATVERRTTVAAAAAKLRSLGLAVQVFIRVGWGLRAGLPRCRRSRLLVVGGQRRS